MAVDALLHSLHEYFTLSDDVKSGCASIEELQEVKKRVAKALNDYIEFRLDSVIEQRKRRDSSQMRNVIVVPESNSAIIWSDVEKLVKDLTNAPKPINIDDLNFENFKIWMEDYDEWFQEKNHSLNLLPTEARSIKTSKDTFPELNLLIEKYQKK